MTVAAPTSGEGTSVPPPVIVPGGARDCECESMSVAILSELPKGSMKLEAEFGENENKEDKRHKYLLRLKIPYSFLIRCTGTSGECIGKIKISMTSAWDKGKPDNESIPGVSTTDPNKDVLRTCSNGCNENPVGTQYDGTSYEARFVDKVDFKGTVTITLTPVGCTKLSATTIEVVFDSKKEKLIDVKFK
jgi:hypothetical protein